MKTKFELDDIVWYLDTQEHKVRKSVVRRIDVQWNSRVKHGNRDLETREEYGLAAESTRFARVNLEELVTVPSHKLFATKEELIASLE